jgi:signal transduction histidine kinase
MNALLANVPATTGEQIATLVHDLGSPTATIVSIADAMLSGMDGELTDPQRKHLNRIREIGRYLLDLGRDVLAVAGLDGGSTAVLPRPVDVGRVLRTALDISSPRAAAKSIQLKIEEPRPIEALADPKALLRVVDNLVSNAIKFSPPGAKVVLGVREHGGHVAVSVTDNGPGIPADETPLLFQKFSTTSVRATKGERGSGLGLYIARRLTELQGGAIHVRTARGWGTSFEVELPLAR